MHYPRRSIVIHIYPSFTCPVRFETRDATDPIKCLCTWGFQFGFLYYTSKAKSGHFVRSTPRIVGSRWNHAWHQQNRSYFSIIIVPARSFRGRFQKFVFRPSRYFHPDFPRSNYNGRLIIHVPKRSHFCRVKSSFGSLIFLRHLYSRTVRVQLLVL